MKEEFLVSTHSDRHFNPLEELADKEFTSVSGLLKKGAEKLLLDHGIDWRKEDTEGAKD